MLISKSINIRKELAKKWNSLCNSERTVFIVNILKKNKGAIKTRYVEPTNFTDVFSTTDPES